MWNFLLTVYQLKMDLESIFVLTSKCASSIGHSNFIFTEFKHDIVFLYPFYFNWKFRPPNFTEIL